MKIAKMICSIGAALALALGAGAVVVPVVRPVVRPVIRSVDLRADEKPTTVEAWHVEARVSGVFATVTTAFTVRNPNARPLEGALEFPLPDGARVCGYALDIDGVMTDGVVVPKEKARVAFEREVKKGVDPGLVEHLKGNAYRTRLYPIPAQGARRVRLVYVTPLAFAPNGDAALVLAMPRTRLGERTVSITVPMGNGVSRPVLGGLGDARFAEAESVWRSETREADVTPAEDVTVALPALPARLVAVETHGAETWFAVNERVPDLDRAKTSLPLTWRILWDASGSRTPRDLAAARAVLEKLPENACYELIVFSCRAEKPVLCATRAELLGRLDRCGADGGTDFAALADALRKGPPCENRTLLFTDGVDALSADGVDFGDNKPLALVSGAVRDLAFLRRLCAGRVVDLSLRTPDEALAEIANPSPTLVGVCGDGITHVQGVGQAARGRVTVLGRLVGETATVRLDYGGGRLSEPVTIRRADARAGRTLATAWAASRVEDLSARADDHAAELLALGRCYGLVSPATSLLVFERLEQWLDYDVEPPATATALHAAWMKRRPSAAQRAEQEAARTTNYFARLRREWQERVDWWENPIPPKPKTPSSGLFGAVGVGGAVPSARRTASRDADVTVDAGAINCAPPVASVAEADVSVDVADASVAVADVSVAAAEARLSKAERETGCSVAATVTVMPWDPDTPYLRVLKDARTVFGANGELLYAEYLAQRRVYARSPAFYLDCAGFFFGCGERARAVRILSNLLELRLEDPGLLRVCAWRLKEAGAYDAALPILRKVARLRPEQPFAWRDLAQVLEARGRRNRCAADLAEALKLYHKTAFTAWMVEIDIWPTESGIWPVGSDIWTVGSGIWTGVVALEEFNALAAWVERQTWKEGGKPVVPEIEAVYRRNLDADVRIALEWDVDNTDIDLHVLEPDGEEAFYEHRRTSSGGYVSHDVTTGYGPEEYLKKTGAAGTYRILVHYYGSGQQTLTGPATVTATVFTNWGRADETRQTLSLRLDKVKDKVPVGTVEIKP